MKATYGESPIRWRADTGWELRCQSCAARRRECYWPLEPYGEFWYPKRGLQRCKACFRDRDALFQRIAYAKDPDRKRARQRAYYRKNRAANRIISRLRWEATLADPEKHAKAIERSRESSRRYRERRAA